MNTQVRDNGQLFTPHAASYRPAGAMVVMALVAIVGSGTPSEGQVFSDDPLVPGTAVKAAHIMELRQAIANLRALRGLPAVPFTDTTLIAAAIPVRAIHITELRNALNDVFDAAGQARPVYADVMIASMPIKAVHITELRTAARTPTLQGLQLTVARTGTGGGTIASTPSGLICNIACSETFTFGSSVTLSVTPVVGSQFDGWNGGGCGGTGTCTIALTSNTTVTAAFTKIAPNSAPLTVAGIDPPTASPFSLVTVTGTGFDPASSAISVYLSPVGFGLPLAVPVVSATATTVTFVAPPLLDQYFGGFASGPVQLQVVAISGSTMATSAFVSGLSITMPPSTALAAGPLTKMFLESGVNVAGTTKLAAGPGDFSTSLTQLQASLTSLIAGIDTIIATPAATVSLPTTNGTTFVLDGNTLGKLDALVLGYLEQFSAQTAVVTSTGGPSSADVDQPCPTHAHPDYQRVVASNCTFQRYHQNRAQIGKEAVQLGAKIESGVYLVSLGALPAVAAIGVNAVVEAAAKAWQLLSTAITPYVTSYFEASPKPPISQPLSPVGAKILEAHAAEGKPVLASTTLSYEAFLKAAGLAPPGPPTAPPQGVITSSITATTSPGSDPISLIRSSGTIVSVLPLVAPQTQRNVPIDTSFVPSCAECFTREERAYAICDNRRAAGLITTLEQLICVNNARFARETCQKTCQ